VGGLIFLAIAVLGKISGKIAPSKNGRIASAVLGCIFLALGLFIQFRARPSALPQPVSPLPDQTVTAATQVPAGSEPTAKPVTATPSRAQPTAIPPTPTPTLAPTATPAPAARAPDPALIEVLTGEDAPEKAMAAMRIGATSYSEGVVQALIECLDDFTRLIPSDKIPMIPPGPLSTDPNETTASEQCVNALVRIGEPAVEPLIAALAGDYGFWHLEHIAEALGLIGDARALPPLLELLNQGRVELISIAVGRLGGEEAYQALLKAYQEDDNLQNHSRLIWALGYTQDERFLPILLELASRDDRYFKLDGIIALGHLRHPGAVPRLTELLAEEDTHVRWFSCDALGEIGSPEAIPALKGLLETEEHPTVKRAATEALELLGAAE